MTTVAPFPAGIDKEVGSTGIISVGGYLETYEETAELRWPNDTIIFDRMRHTDAQVRSTLRAVNLPIRSTRWSVVGEECDPRVVRFVEVELGLVPMGKGRRRRRRQGIVWDDFLSHVLIHLPMGHMPFEQVYEVGDPGPELADQNLPAKVAHLRKLAPRLPRTISRFDIATDGGLAAIHQWVLDSDGHARDVELPIDRLVMFTNEREGSDWTGTSVLRAAYKHWLIKDALIRLGPMVAERNGMGYPTVTFPAGGDQVLALKLARDVRAGEDTGAAMPEGYILDLVGVKGTLKDELPLVKYHDEAIGRNLLAMILDLGHDAGARALGTVFADMLAASLNAVTANVEETSTEHVIRDLVTLNFGEDEPYPELIAEEIEADAVLSATDLQVLVEAGVILPDRDLEADTRRRYGLPDLPDPEEYAEAGVPDPHDRNGPGVDPDETAGPLGQPGGLPLDDTGRPARVAPGATGGPAAIAPGGTAGLLAAGERPRRRLRTRDELEARAEQVRRRLAARR